MSTQFQEMVREVVRDIPAGSVMTYKEVAEATGHPRAHRAVANVMASNYDPTVPCHRVIRSDGGLGGYNRGGVETKRNKRQNSWSICIACTYANRASFNIIISNCEIVLQREVIL